VDPEPSPDCGKWGAIDMVRVQATKPDTEGPVARLDDDSDGDLLEQFCHGEELAAEDAFGVLVERHGPMVLAICRHVLGQAQDAEDAFQATFLALARRGDAISDPRALSGWLREVAYRIALRSRVRASRTRAIERQAMEMVLGRDESAGPEEIVSLSELRPVLREEVARLPEKYRVPVILSYLEGRTNQEVAELLDWPVGTVKGRLMRARVMLRSRLSRRGVAPCTVRLSC
jgi:RNA polymerase sigma factor (sigma-70 family)